MKRISLIFVFVSALILSLGIGAYAGSGAISISKVDGLVIDNNTLNAQLPSVRFVLKLNNDATEKCNISNGWRVYSPDGASWLSSSLDTLPPNVMGGDGWTISVFGRYFDVTFGSAFMVGDGAPTDDILGILGAGSPGKATKQLPVGYNDTALAITVQLGAVTANDPTPALGDEKHLCIDSAFWGSGGTWKWVTASLVDIFPTWSSTFGVADNAGGYCFTLYNVPNLAPVISNAPASIPASAQKYCSTFTFDFNATDNEGDPYTFVQTGGPGAIDASTGVWSWNGATIADVGASISIVVHAKDAQDGPSVTVPILVGNEAPVITNNCPVDGGFMSTGASKTVQMTGTDDCGSLIWSVVDDGDPSTTVSISPTGLLSFSPANAGTFTEVVTLSDGALSTTCEVTFTVSAKSAMGVTIEKTHMTLQGGFEYVDVTLDYAAYELGGFNLLISYDNSAMSLQEVLKGTIYSECGWEYFTYRFGADGNCSGGCPSGLVRVVGMAETNNGAFHPTCFGAAGQTLFTLKFLVSNDRSLECQYAPIRFFWLACEDNTLSDKTGGILYIASRVYDYHDIASNIAMVPPADFPSYGGVPVGFCVNPMPNKPNPIRDIDFYNGGIDIACADSIDARADLNLNGIGYEIGDAVLFSRYFVYGLGVFTINQGGQIAASDANADGLTLTVADLVYLIKVVVGDLQPYAKVSPVAATYVNDNGVLSVDGAMGAAYVVVKGNVTPELLANDMAIMYNFDGTNTRVLVYPNLTTLTTTSFSGDFLNVGHSEIVSIEMASANGGTVAGKLIPADFGLAQNYPNPFNPTTNISFNLPKSSDYSLTIYNVTGQKVAEFSGTHEAGTVKVEWNASGNASGIYFYKLNAGSFSATKKMVLLK